MRRLAASLLAAGLIPGQAPPSAEPPDAARMTLGALVDGSAFVKIRPGRFRMGDAAGRPGESPEHTVRISRGFEITRYEVTQAQWMAAMLPAHPKPGEPRDPWHWNPSKFKERFAPVESVNWDAVQKFMAVLNRRDPKHLYRLPTEAEWEFACKAGRDDSAASPEQSAWMESNADGRTHLAGRKQPNAWGLHDMQGNVWEWVADFYAPDTYERGDVTDPQGPAAGSYRVYRGGGWYSGASYCRCSTRGFDFPVEGYYAVGFRVVRVPRR